MKPIDLSLVLLSPFVVQSWQEIIVPAAGELVAGGVNPIDIPDEQAAIMPDGRLKIFVEVPGHEISLMVSAEHWAYRMPQN